MPYGKNSKKLSDCKPFHSPSLDRISVKPFDVSNLGSETLMRLYCVAAPYRERIRVEIGAGLNGHKTKERNPAPIVGIELGQPTIRFSDSLNWSDRIEAIAHELAHLFLVYRYGLGVIGRQFIRLGGSGDVFKFFTTRSRLSVILTPRRWPAFGQLRFSRLQLFSWQYSPGPRPHNPRLLLRRNEHTADLHHKDRT